MKLPWDKNYLKISFHVVITAIVLCFVTVIIGNITTVAVGVEMGFKWLMSLVAPLIIGVIVAFLLDTAVDFYDGKGNTKRTKGTVFTYITVGFILASVVTFAAKKVGSSNITSIAEKANLYIEELSDLLLAVQIKIGDMGVFGVINGVINSTIINVTRFLKDIVIAVTTKLTTIGNFAFNIFLGFVLAFYFLQEKYTILKRLKHIIKVIFPRKINRHIFSFFKDVNKIFSGYVKGQILDAFIMAVLITLSFWIIGIEHAVVIGLVSGFSNLIPYVGAIVAFVLSVVVALVGDEPIKAVYAAIIVIVLQQIDGMIIVPKVVGERVKLHPILVILSLTVFGGLFGIGAMVVAVPTTALIKLYFDRYIRWLEIKRLEK